MALKQDEVTWFRPLWRRIAIAVLLTGWLGWELLISKDMFWALLVGAALAYSLYNFFYAFPRQEPAETVAALPPAGDDDDVTRP